MWKIAAAQQTHRVSGGGGGTPAPGTGGGGAARLTLHDVVVPTVRELPVVPVLVQPPQEDLVGVAVLQVDQLPQARQEGGVAVGAVLVGQDGHLVAHLGGGRGGTG